MTFTELVARILRSDPGLIGITTLPFVVTPHNSTNFAIPSRYFYVASAGAVKLVSLDDSVVTYTVPDGSYIFAPAKRVNSTGTTASGIVGHP